MLEDHTMTELKNRLAYDAEFIENKLSEILDLEYLGGHKMAEAMRYATLGG